MDQIHNYILALLSLLPLLFIVKSNAWRESDYAGKLVMGGLLVWAVASCFSRHMAVQFFCGFALFALIYAIKKRHFKTPGIWTYLYFAYFAWHAVSLLWTTDLKSGVFQLRVYSLFVFIPLTFCCFELSKEQKETIMTGFFRAMSIFIAATICTWLIWCISNNSEIFEWLIIRKSMYDMQPSYSIIYAWSNYTHPTYNGVPILIGMAIGIYKTSGKIGWDKPHYIETIIYSLSALLVIILSQSRICLIGWLLMAFIGTLYLLRENKTLQIVTAFSIILICIAGAFIGEEYIKRFVNDPIRIQNLTTAKYYINSHPLLGSGIEGIREVMDSNEIAQQLGYQYANKGLANPHQQFIGDCMQTGIIGMTLSLSIFALLFYTAVKRKDFMLFATMVVMLLIANIEMPFYLHKGVIQFLLFTGWFTSGYGITQKERQCSSHK
ncbi:MAG: O-antigen ligase family protein [Paludibacteraceae bacterium]|nr:O-antigen ligase family protein [Paludibacteraceae bacterium]